MRGGDDVGSRMRVAAAACLVSSGLLVGGVSAAVASADPEGGSDQGGAGTPSRTSGESAGHQHRSGPREIGRVGSVTKAGSGSIGRRFPAPPAVTLPAPDEPAEDAADDGDSKLSETADPGAETVSEGASGEQDAVEEPDDEDEECGWWPLPPDRDLPASSTGGGYDGAAPPTGMVIAPPDDLLPDAPQPLIAADPPEPLSVLAAPVLSLPVIAVPPVVAGIGGTGAGGAVRAPADVEPVRPPVRREPPQPPAAPPVSDTAVPVSYRAGYVEYLRTADLPQVVAVAVPGATGIMLLTGAGGLIGYRQARAGHAIRAGTAGRFSS